ncbi:MAG TPA: methyltransferase domain-containing protein [Candidatus Acidoferrales bacterium]|nr:methyltransferase domain-containing protein [Candidatus Acidoferrales bacterium]
MRDLSLPIRILQRFIRQAGIPRDCSVLVIGAGKDDAPVLRGAGFRNLALSNITSAGLQLNAEALSLPDDSYDLVFAHCTLHHCRSPYKALAEMLRVASRWIVFFEPNDSVFARLAVWTGLKQPYEICAVTDNGQVRGGVMDTGVPNFIHRWTPAELKKAALCAVPERRLRCYSFRYWDFNYTPHELEISASSWNTFARIAQKSRSFLNLIPPIRALGNHFFGAVAKQDYHPWIKDGHFDPDYAEKNKAESQVA